MSQEVKLFDKWYDTLTLASPARGWRWLSFGSAPAAAGSLTRASAAPRAASGAHATPKLSRSPRRRFFLLFFPWSLHRSVWARRGLASWPRVSHERSDARREARER